jgi:hypothetical protein
MRLANSEGCVAVAAAPAAEGASEKPEARACNARISANTCVICMLLMDYPVINCCSRTRGTVTPAALNCCSL